MKKEVANGCFYSDEIKVGEYIRTIDGFIDKVIVEYKGKCNNPNCLEKHISCELDYYCEKEITKHSFNIIDLIEVGDYVNGEQIIDIWHGSRISSIKSNFDNEDIKDIVTHEQFEQMKYIVKE